MRKLAFQLLLVELLTLEYLHGFRNGGDRVSVFLDFRQDRDLRGRAGSFLQPGGGIGIFAPLFAPAHDGHLLKLLELIVGKAPDGEIGEVVRKDLADVLGQTVVRDHVDQQPTLHQVWKALDEEALFMPRSASALRDDGEVRRIEKEQMKGLVADPAVKEAADAHAGQARLCLLRTGFVQLHTVGEAVVAVGELAQRFAAAAAGIEQIRRHALREVNALQHIVNVLRVGGIVAHSDIVHQTADDRRVHRVLCLRQLFRKAGQHLIDRLVGAAHEIEPGQPLMELSRSRGKRVFLNLQKRQLRIAQRSEDALLRLLKLQIRILRPLQIRFPVLFHLRAVCQQVGAAFQDRGAGSGQLFQNKIAFVAFRQPSHRPLPSAARAGCSAAGCSSCGQAPFG